ncbi:MAG TPA: hypothetical protein PLZ60_12645 [Kiritimatiellia bacterium]|jgi:hypothetical protein|nr:hypothetical protein [Kiritimatiellia bacterium]
MNTDHASAWPTCRSQTDAGLPDGPIDSDDTSLDRLDMFALGWGIGLLLGLVLPDLIVLAGDLLP